MKLKSAEINQDTKSIAPDANLDEAGDIDLYDDLLIFTDLSPEEQKAALNRPAPAPPQQSPVKIPETGVVYEQQAFEPPPETASDPLRQTNKAFVFEPRVEAAKDSDVNTVKQPAIQPVKESASEPPQANTFGKGNSTELQLADILRVTDQLNDISKETDLMSACLDCGSLADSEDVFCINCGGTLGEVELVAPPSCDDCGAAIESDEIFCPSCGSATFDG